MAKKKIERTDQLDLTKDEDILTLVQGMILEGETGNQRRRERMKRCRRFRVGDQWDDDVKQWYRSGRKHALTINRILPTILQVAGVHAENKKDLTARPTRGGTDVAARIVTALIKHTLHSSMFHSEHNDAFRKAIGDGAGYLHVLKDFKDDPRDGNLIVQQENPFNVYADASVEEYDLNKSGRYIYVHKWMDEEEAKRTWPDKAEEIQTGRLSMTNNKGIFAGISRFFFGDNADDYREDDNESIDEQRQHKVQITWVYWKEYRDVGYLYRVDDDELEPLKLTKSEDLTFARKLAKDKPNEATFVERVEPLLHLTKINGDVFLEDTPNPWAYKDNPDEGVMEFPIVPLYAYFEDGYIFSIVDNLISPQEEHNYARSTLLNISKKLANTGWIGKGLGDRFKQWLETNGSQDGVVIDAPDGATRLEKIEPTQIPNNIVLNAQLAREDIADIAAVKLDRKDFSKSELTNQARAIKERDALVASNTLFANDEHTMLILGTFLSNVIRNTNVYSEEEIKAIVDESDMLDGRIMKEAQEVLADEGAVLPQPPADIQAQLVELQDQPETLAALVQGFQQEMQLFQQAQQEYQELVTELAQSIILQEISTLRVGKYGMMIDEIPHSPTMRLANYLELLELHKTLIESNYPGIPREQLIEASDAPNKDAIIATPAPVQPQQTALEAA